MIARSFLRWLLLGIVALAIVAREPTFLTSPRFWAEEGTICFRFAWHHSWWEALFTPQLGYYSLWTNLAVVLAARVAALEYAPLVTTLMALAVQLLPFAVVFWSDSPLWATTVNKALFAVLAFTTSSSGEIWLNVINSQFHLCLATFLILVDEESRASLVRWFKRLVVALAGLTGVASILLLPFFLVAWCRGGRREARVHAVALLSGCLLQVPVHAYFGDYKSVGARAAGTDVLATPLVLVQHVFVKPLVGLDLATTSSRLLTEGLELAGPHGAPRLLAALILVLLIYGGLRRLAGPLALRPRPPIAEAVLLVSLVSAALATSPSRDLLDPRTGSRYFYAPAIFWLVALHDRAWSASASRTSTRLAIAAWLMVVGAGLLYLHSSLFFDPSWPRWREEVVQWRFNPDHALRVWPGWGDWRMSLMPRKGDRRAIGTIDLIATPLVRNSMLVPDARGTTPRDWLVGGAGVVPVEFLEGLPAHVVRLESRLGAPIALYQDVAIPPGSEGRRLLFAAYVRPEVDTAVHLAIHDGIRWHDSVRIDGPSDGWRLLLVGNDVAAGAKQHRVHVWVGPSGGATPAEIRAARVSITRPQAGLE